MRRLLGLVGRGSFLQGFWWLWGLENLCVSVCGGMFCVLRRAAHTLVLCPPDANNTPSPGRHQKCPPHMAGCSLGVEHSPPSALRSSVTFTRRPFLITLLRPRPVPRVSILSLPGLLAERSRLPEPLCFPSVFFPCWNPRRGRVCPVPR